MAQIFRTASNVAPAVAAALQEREPTTLCEGLSERHFLVSNSNASLQRNYGTAQLAILALIGVLKT